ncbi:MAG: hypothetical protein ABL866_04005 [Devosia sp.]
MPVPTGRGDPTASFTDMQWYMYHQRNVAFFAAFTARPLSDADLLLMVEEFVALTPQVRQGYDDPSPGAPLPAALLKRLIHRQSVPTLAGFPDRWVDDGAAVFSDPALPLFRVRYAEAETADANDHVGFLIVQVAHALVEGADSALLSRSQSAAHPVTTSPYRAEPLVRAAAVAMGAVLAALHLLAGNLYAPHPGPFRYASRVVPRHTITVMARELGVRQRALLFGLVMETLFGAASGRRRKLTTTYSVIDDGGGASRDSFMRMRMRFASFAGAEGFVAFARAVDAQLSAAEVRESGFNDEINAEGIRNHRRWRRRVPGLYRPRLFAFMPYDLVLGLIPPHRLGGGLTAHLREPVFAGASLEGANACVIVPGRDVVTFNFYIQDQLLSRIPRLDELLRAPVQSSDVHLTMANP